jgi:hypothetical protein
MKNFIVQLSIISIISSGLYYLIGIAGTPYFFSWHPFIAGFFFIVTLFFHKGLQNSLEKGNQQFIRYYMGATAVKLMLILLFVIIIALTNKSIAMNFTLCTFFYYLFFSSFEVWLSMKKIGRK